MGTHDDVNGYLPLPNHAAEDPKLEERDNMEQEVQEAGCPEWKL